MPLSNKKEVRLVRNLNCPIPEALEWFATMYLYLAQTLPHYVKDFWEHPKIKEAQRILEEKYKQDEVK
jgi:hypothetical protein